MSKFIGFIIDFIEYFYNSHRFTIGCLVLLMYAYILLYIKEKINLTVAILFFVIVFVCTYFDEKLKQKPKASKGE